MRAIWISESRITSQKPLKVGRVVTLLDHPFKAVLLEYWHAGDMWRVATANPEGYAAGRRWAAYHWRRDRYIETWLRSKRAYRKQQRATDARLQ